MPLIAKKTVHLAFQTSRNRSNSFESIGTNFGDGSVISPTSRGSAAITMPAGYPWVTSYTSASSGPVLQATLYNEDFVPFNTIEGPGILYRGGADAPGGETTYGQSSYGAVLALIAIANKPFFPLDASTAFGLSLKQGEALLDGTTLGTDQTFVFTPTTAACALVNRQLADSASSFPHYTVADVDVEETIVPCKTGGGDPYTTVTKKFKYKLSSGKNVVGLTMPVYLEMASGSIVARSSLDDLIEPPTYEVARRNYDKALKLAIARAAQGQSFTDPGATIPFDISAVPENLRSDYQDWWTHSSDLRASLISAKPLTTEEAYVNYSTAGGVDAYSTWEGNRDSRATTASNAKTESAFASGLGWVADKAADGLSWLGNSALDLMKSWGPMGTVGAYAGFKAVGSASGSNLLPWVIGGAALLLLAK